MRKCINCNGYIEKNIVLFFEGMPSSAQYMPTSETLENDNTIDLQVVQCKNCGLVQLNNECVPYYREVIRAAAVSKEFKAFRTIQFSEFLKYYNLMDKELIEIACGNGEYLRILKSLNEKTSGIEFKKIFVEDLSKEGFEVFQGYIDSSDYQISNNKYDAFFLLNYLEHCPEPGVFLKGICNNLKNEAYGMVEVPNFDMIINQHMFSEFIIDHIAYYTEDTLRAVLTSSGFEVLKIEKNWDDYILTAIVKKRTQIDLKEFIKTQSDLIGQINEYVDSFESGTIAVWGAGHQALTLMALAKLNNRIKYVIDSADFKQGKYTQATHIPIVSPEILKEGIIKTVIIMAAGYSNEIKRIIESEYDGISIAIVDKTHLSFLD